MKHLIFDTWPLIAFFEGQKSADSVEYLLQKCRNKNIQPVISVINLGELWYTITRRYSETEADLLLKEIRSLHFKAYPANWNITKTAAKFKVKGGISYADCFAAALAFEFKAPLVTGDKEFKLLEKDIDILWV